MTDPELPAQPTRRFRPRHLTAGLAALALVVAGVTGVARLGGGELAALAATSTPSASPSAGSATPSPGDRTRRPHRKGWRGGPGLLGLAGALRGEAVLPDGKGGYQTVVLQRGTATEVGSATLSVRSKDGYTATYDVPAGTAVGARRAGLASIQPGASVLVLAVKAGSTLTARRVIDLAGLRDFGRQFGGGQFGPGVEGRGSATGV